MTLLVSMVAKSGVNVLSSSLSSRRTLLRQALGAALALPAVGVLAACGGAATATTSTSAATSSAAPTSAAPVPTAATGAASTASATASVSAVATTSSAASTAAATTTSAASSAVQASSTVTPTSSAKGAVVTVNQWDYYDPSASPSFATWFKQMPAEFQAKYPNIKPDFTYFPNFSDLPTKYTAAVAGGTPPDLVHSSVIWSRDFWTAGTLLNLDAQVAQTPAVAMDQFSASSLFYNQAQGHVFGIPLDGPDSECIMYDVDRFKAAGIDTDPNTTMNWTWQQFLDNATKLTTHDSSGKVVIAGYVPAESDIARLSTWLYTDGSSFYNQDLTGVAFDTAEGIEALQFLMDRQNKYDLWWKSNAPDTTLGHVLDGQAAMALSGTWNIQYVQDTAPHLNFEIIPMPHGPHGKPATMSWENMLVIPKGTKTADAAWTFVVYQASLDTQVERLGILNRVCPRKDFYTSPQVVAAEKKLPQLAWVGKIGDLGGAQPFFRNAELDKTVSPVIEKAIMTNQISAADAIHQAAQLANAILAKK